MITIELTNNKSKLSGSPQKALIAAQKKFKVKNPNAFYLRKFMSPDWDGCQDFITNAGYFETGLLPEITLFFEEHNYKYRMVDNRILSNLKINKDTSTWSFQPRDYQLSIATKILKHKVDGLHFPRGLLKFATNAGKTYIAATLYNLVKRPTVIVINEATLYNQAVKEDFPKLIPDGKMGYLRGKEFKEGDFMVCMAKTLAIRIEEKNSRVMKMLARAEIALIDECDLAENATYKRILYALYGCQVKVGMSGSVLVSNLAKYRIKNMKIKGYFGPLLGEVSNRDLIEKGVSSEVKVRILPGNTKLIDEKDINLEYEKGITKNRSRHKLVAKTIRKHDKMGHEYFLVMCKYHAHVKRMYEYLKDNVGNLSIDWVHGGRSDREAIIAKFKAGKLDVLVSSGIIKRGKNLPLADVMINTGGGDSPENAIQMIGRMTRKKEGRKHKYFYDFYDLGNYLERHSKHRMAAYKTAGFGITKLYTLDTI